MAHLNHAAAYQELKDQVLAGISDHFPIQGKLKSLHLDGLEVRDEGKDFDDIEGQKAAKLEGRTWSAPVYANLKLVDNVTGHTIDQKQVRVAEIPKVTRRHSYIVNGQEYQVSNQWQLKPGAYVRRRNTGELQTQFNVAGRPPFSLTFDPASKKFVMVRGSSNIPLYPILNTLGIDDHTLEKEWGKEILAANRDVRGVGTAVDRFYKADKKNPAPDPETAKNYVIDILKRSELRPDATERTLGKPYASVTGDTLRAATAKMLKVQAGAPEDDRDSLAFKDLRSTADFVNAKLTNWKTKQDVKAKVARKINYANNVRDVIKFDMFNAPVMRTFTDESALASRPKQINPIEMLANAMQTTVMGEGGIKKAQQINDEVKFVNPSHLGFIDPIHTPESDKTGVVLHLPIGLQKVKNTPKLPLYSLTTGKTELVDPSQFLMSNVVLPDQVTWKDGKPVPIGRHVQMAVQGNKIAEGPFSKAHYVLQHSSQLFDVATNMIPFVNNNSGNRATYAASHISQAVSLHEREAPLVQVGTGSQKKGLQTFEELIGRQSGHPALTAGTVTKVTKSNVTIKDDKGKSHDIQLYDNFPLNDPKAVLHSTPIVKVGDKVEAGQTVADTNFMKDGKLALGRNLRIAYVPFRGYNFEDGVVISESAAKKLSSLHLHKPSLPLEENLVLDTKKFKVKHPGVFTRDQYETVGDDGVVKKGTVVHTGDPLVVAMRPYQLKDRMGLGAISKSLSGHHSDVSLRWESDHPGEVVGISRKGDSLTVHVKTVEPLQLGDKVAGRHGNKGIVSLVLPDREMPHTKDGKPIEMALNPSGIPGRINVGQVLETAAAKIAQKTGKTYIANNFSRDDAVERVKKELKEHGLTDTEELHDPVTGVSLGKALVGPQYMLKLTHQIDKKISARSGMGLPGVGGGETESYNRDLVPSGGGKTGGQSLDIMTINALLAHGAKANIREAQTWKSEGPDPQTNISKQWPSQHIAVWKAIQEGTNIPLPRPTFSFKKFTDMLKAAGINIEKKGHTFQLTPLTDRHILSMSNGELTKPILVLDSKLDANGEPKTKAGGLFDPKVTGGVGGYKWSHIKLAEPVPNPVFAKAICGVTGITEKQFNSLVSGEQAINRKGDFVSLETHGAITGGAAVKHLLEQVNVQKELAETKQKLATLAKTKGTDAPSIDKLVSKAKYLRALDQLDMKPHEAYVLHNLPVIPPVMRPASVLPSGAVQWADLNKLYQEFAQVNEKLGDPHIRGNLTDQRLKPLRSDYYDGVKAIVGMGKVEDDDLRGVLSTISGAKSPKTGYFQKSLTSRRQDLSMRSVIVPEPALELDQVGLPEKKAMTLYRPFVVRKLIEMGAASNALEAQEMVAKNHRAVKTALELAVKDRPVILKRDPALHKHSALAFTPKLVSGRAIQIHPLVTSGFNADFDGDTMSAYVPISTSAVEEARKMFPTHNLFNEATGKVMYQPTLESALGLYKLSVVKSGTHKTFASPVEALKAVQDRKLTVNDPIKVGGTETTAGRLLIANALPTDMRDQVLKSRDPIDKKGLEALFSQVARHPEHSKEFGNIANKLKDLGNGMSFGAIELMHPDHKGPAAVLAKEDPKRHIQFIPTTTHTLSLDDFAADKATRDPIFAKAQHEVDNLGNISAGERDRRTIEIWKSAAKQVEDAHKLKIAKDPSNLAMMQMAGVKPSWDQYKQMVLAPVLVSDAGNRIIPRPLKRSYSEGLDVGDYWTQMSGARRGTVMKVQEVRDPGALSKALVATAVNLVVTGHDCGTTHGIALPVHSGDLHDRILARDFTAKGLTVPAGTLLAPDVVNKMRAADKNATVMVRSPLKCEHGTGLCQKCAGLGPNGRFYDLGTNTGLLAAQSLGERSVQVTLKAFHGGGVVSSGGHQVTDDFTRIEQLTKLPQPNHKSSDVAVLAMHSGAVTKIDKDATGVKIWINNHVHHVGKDRFGRLLHEDLPHAGEATGYKPWTPPKVGTVVQAGQTLTDPNRTLINPHDLYRATKSMDRVQNFMAEELHGIYRKEGVRRQHVETLVKSLGNLTKVRDPGDAEGILPGEFQPYSKVLAMNTALVKAGKRPIEHTPKLQGVDVMPLEVQEDWMAKLQHQQLRKTLSEGAAMAAVSNIHGLHPIPGIAYGAEFGLTSDHSRRPNLEHLKDVPAYAY